MDRPVRIRSVVPEDGFRVRLQFTDSSERVVDLEPYLRGPIFEPLRRDPSAFRSVHVDERAGTIVWDNGADIDPDVLYRGLSPSELDRENELSVSTQDSSKA